MWNAYIKSVGSFQTKGNALPVKVFLGERFGLKMQIADANRWNSEMKKYFQIHVTARFAGLSDPDWSRWYGSSGLSSISSAA